MAKEQDQVTEEQSGKAGQSQSDNAPDKTTPKEIGGRKGPEPTRYGDWEKNGIISDF